MRDSLRALFAEISDAAKINNLPPPVIMTDVYTGSAIARALWDGIFPGVMPASIEREPGLVTIFDDVRIVTERYRPEERYKPEEKEWRDHFGILADIWVNELRDQRVAKAEAAEKQRKLIPY